VLNEGKAIVMTTNIQKWRLNFDGLCHPINPGGTAIGSWVIQKELEIVETGAHFVCKGKGATCNVAEWAGLVHGLAALAKHTSGVIEIIGDSQLVINQLNGNWRVHKEHLRLWKEKAVEALKHFDTWNASWVPRNLNEAADEAGRDKYKEIHSQ